MHEFFLFRLIIFHIEKSRLSARIFFSNFFGARIFFFLFPLRDFFLPHPHHFSNGPPLTHHTLRAQCLSQLLVLIIEIYKRFRLRQFFRACHVFAIRWNAFKTQFISINEHWSLVFSANHKKTFYQSSHAKY